MIKYLKGLKVSDRDPFLIRILLVKAMVFLEEEETGLAS
jgi:hypothetical protein